MTCNLLANVLTQFRTRGYRVGEIHRDDQDRWLTFTILEYPNRAPVGVAVTFIPDANNPRGELWQPSDIRWATNMTQYQGVDETSPAALADAIIATIEVDHPS